MLKSQAESTDIKWQCSQCRAGIVGPRPDQCPVCGGLLEAIEESVFSTKTDFYDRYVEDKKNGWR